MTTFDSKILDRMWQRVEQSKLDSDIAYFHDLMLLGELAVKLMTVATLACVESDRDRQRYKIEYQLSRADGIGEWSRAFSEVLVGPASAFIATEARPIVREFTENFSQGSDSWQRIAIDALSAAAKSIDGTLEEAPRKSSIQWWTTAFAALRNRTRGHGAITGVKCSAAAPSLEKSITALLIGSSILSTPWIYLHRNISGKYRVSLIAGNIERYSHLKSERDHAYQDGVYIGIADRLLAVPLISSDVDVQDVFVANGGYKPKSAQVPTASYELLSYISDTRHRQSAEAYQTPPESLPPSETEGKPNLDVDGNSFANIPPGLPDYIRRPDIESEVIALLKEADRYPIVTLVGRGGIGKTSLALEVLHELADAGDYFAILWFSSRDIDLLSTGPKPVRPAVLSKEDIAKQFAALMHPSSSKEKGFKATEYLASSLSDRDPNRRLLLVFDNFETAAHPIELYQFIDSYVRSPNKVLITTRMRDFKADFPVEIRGLKRDEFEDLVVNTARKLGIEGLLNHAYIESLYDETDGHPYFAKILLGDAQREGKAVPVKHLFLNKEDSLRALFERSYGLLTPAAQRVFLTLSNWRSLVPRMALEAALLRPQNDTIDVSDALGQLERYSMIEVVTDQQGDEFLRTPVTASVFGQSKLKLSPFRAAVLADTALIQQFGPMQVIDVARGMAPRIERMIRVIDALRLRGENYETQMRALQYVADQYPDAWLRIAEFYMESPKEEDWAIARTSIERFLEKDSESVRALRKLIGINRRLSDVSGELNARTLLAEIPGVEYSEIANAASCFAHAQSNQLIQMDPEARHLAIMNLISLMEDRIDEATPSELGFLAWLFIYAKDATRAGEIVRKGLDRDPSNPHLVKLSRTLKDQGEV
ncbi:NB-ARC domain-containing protein [Streptomyces fungicidicus]